MWPKRSRIGEEIHKTLCKESESRQGRGGEGACSSEPPEFMQNSLNLNVEAPDMEKCTNLQTMFV